MQLDNPQKIKTLHRKSKGEERRGDEWDRQLFLYQLGDHSPLIDRERALKIDFQDSPLKSHREILTDREIEKSEEDNVRVP